MKRKMTIDYGANEDKQTKTETSNNGTKALEDQIAKVSEDSKSQLTLETEEMMPLAAADCLLIANSAASVTSSQKAGGIIPGLA